MRRPSFQFYPDDWSANSNLKRCTHEEKGIWIDIMCILHDQDEYGIARWPLADLAQAVGTTPTKIKRLVTKGVLKGVEAGKKCEEFIFTPRSGRKDGDPVTLIEQQDGPVWYSSRMVLDEYKRNVRGGVTNNPKDTPNHSPKGGLGESIDDTSKGTPDASPSRTRASSPSSSSLYIPPNPQSGGESLEPDKLKPKRKERIQLKTFIERCKTAGEKPISEYKPLLDYVANTGLPMEFVQIAWDVFKREFLPPGQHASRLQADWRRHFLNYIEKGYYRLWYAKQGQDGPVYELSTQGVQAQASLMQEVA